MSRNMREREKHRKAARCHEDDEDFPRGPRVHSTPGTSKTQKPHKPFHHSSHYLKPREDRLSLLRLSLLGPVIVIAQNLICCKKAVSCMAWGKILWCLLFPPIPVKQVDSQEQSAPLHLQSFVLDTPHCKPQLWDMWTKALSGPCEAP